MYEYEMIEDTDNEQPIPYDGGYVSIYEEVKNGFRHQKD